MQSDNEQKPSATILVVEDQQPVLKVVERALQMSGFTVLAASTPQEALGLLRTHGGQVDLLLTDVVMPEMSGPELASMARGASPALRILFMSGYSSVPASDALDGLGEYSILEKPFRPKELIDKVRQLLVGVG